MDAVFKALSDPTRRRILDLLRRKGGLTLSDLEAECPDLTRFGVMKHLKVLEGAQLIATQKRGRFKHHYLNPAPLQEVADRWLAPHIRPWAEMATGLKHRLEQESTMTAAPDFLLETYIQTTPKRLWQAITDPADTEQYYFGARVKSSWEKGAAVEYRTPGDKLMLDGEILEIEPECKLVMTFHPLWGDMDPHVSKVTFTLEPMGKVTKLTIFHEDLIEAQSDVQEGWAMIASGLKTLLETGEKLHVPMG